MKLKQIDGNVLDLSLVKSFLEHFSKENSYADVILNQINEGYYSDFNYPGKVFIDAGANVGMVSLYYAPIYERIIAVEPTPEYCTIIKKICHFFGIRNISVIEAALSPRNENVIISRIENNSTMNNIVGYGHKGFQAKGITIDSLLSSAKINEVDFLKMDIEGAEMEIIPDKSFIDSAPKIKRLIIEVHDFKSGNYSLNRIFGNQIETLLNSYGFKTFRHSTELISAERVS